jgi:hypothetical protein
VRAISPDFADGIMKRRGKVVRHSALVFFASAFCFIGHPGIAACENSKSKSAPAKNQHTKRRRLVVRQSSPRARKSKSHRTAESWRAHASQTAIADFVLGYAHALPANAVPLAPMVLPDLNLTPEVPRAIPVEPNERAQSAVPRRIHYQLGLTVSGVYDDNIDISPTNREGDFYTTIEPMLNIGIGDTEGNFVDLNYRPQVYLFANHSEDDALQHLITLTGQYQFSVLTLSLTQEVQILDGSGLTTPSGTGTEFTSTNLDVAGRTRLNIYTTRLAANYPVTGKTFLTGDLGYSVSDYTSLLSSSVLSGDVYLNYTYSPKLSIGAGLVGGYDAVDSPSQDQLFEQFNLRASYELTGKVSATLSAGVEFRQATEGGATDNGTPVFDGSLFYQPFDGTNIALSLSRGTLNSAALAGEDYHSTSVIASARQRFLQRFFVGLSVGYENSSYFSTESDIASNRRDDYYFAQASLDFNVTSYWTAGVFYFYREDDSSLAEFRFNDNQIGFRTTFTF